MTRRQDNQTGKAGPDQSDRSDQSNRSDQSKQSDRFDQSDQLDCSGDSPFGEVVEIPIEDAIDLHLFSPRDVKTVVLEYLEQASEKGFEEVRIIHGRGIGERRRQVHDLLRNHPLVADFREAPAPRGGWGATVVWLKPLDRGRKPAR